MNRTSLTFSIFFAKSIVFGVSNFLVSRSSVMISAAAPTFSVFTGSDVLKPVETELVQLKSRSGMGGGDGGVFCKCYVKNKSDIPLKESGNGGNARVKNFIFFSPPPVIWILLVP